MRNNWLIWFIDGDSCLQEKYSRAFGFHYRLRHIQSISDLIDITKDKDNKESPALIVSEVKFSDGLLIEAEEFKSFFSTYLDRTVITSSSDDKDMIRLCLKNNIIDYLVKPINMAELSVKIENHMDVLIKGHPTIHKDGFILSEFTSDLTLTEQKILWLFFQNEELKINRDEINQIVWKTTIVQPKTIDVHLFNLRKKMKNKGYDIEYFNQHWKLKKTTEDLA